MHVLSTLLLLSVSSGVTMPAGRAGAACATTPRFAPAIAAAAEGEARDCSEPAELPAIPPVLDCNDDRANLLLGGMIGLCDMPRAAAAAGKLAVKEPRPLPVRDGPTCNLLGCSDGSSPLHGVSRANPGPQPCLTAARPPALHWIAAALLWTLSPLAEGPPPLPLERPPRA